MKQENKNIRDNFFRFKYKHVSIRGECNIPMITAGIDPKRYTELVVKKGYRVNRGVLGFD